MTMESNVASGVEEGKVTEGFNRDEILDQVVEHLRQLRQLVERSDERLPTRQQLPSPPSAGKRDQGQREE